MGRVARGKTDPRLLLMPLTPCPSPLSERDMRWTATLAALVAAVGLSGAQPPPATAVPTGAKVCVYEPQKTTKTAYTSVCKEYCAADYSPLAILKRCCGLNACDGPCPPEPLVKHVLVKKSVPGP